MTKNDHIFLDSSEISQAVKISVRMIGYYVEKYGLPAFKDSDSDNAKWKARPESLKEWAKQHEQRFLSSK